MLFSSSTNKISQMVITDRLPALLTLVTRVSDYRKRPRANVPQMPYRQAIGPAQHPCQSIFQ